MILPTYSDRGEARRDSPFAHSQASASCDRVLRLLACFERARDDDQTAAAGCASATPNIHPVQIPDQIKQTLFIGRWNCTSRVRSWRVRNPSADRHAIRCEWAWDFWIGGPSLSLPLLRTERSEIAVTCRSNLLRCFQAGEAEKGQIKPRSHGRCCWAPCSKDLKKGRGRAT